MVLATLVRGGEWGARVLTEGSRHLSVCVPLPDHRKHLDDCHRIHEPWGPGWLPQGEWPGPQGLPMTVVLLVPHFSLWWDLGSASSSVEMPSGQADLAGDTARPKPRAGQ